MNPSLYSHCTSCPCAPTAIPHPLCCTMHPGAHALYCAFHCTSHHFTMCPSDTPTTMLYHFQLPCCGLLCSTMLLTCSGLWAPLVVEDVSHCTTLPHLPLHLKGRGNTKEKGAWSLCSWSNGSSGNQVGPRSHNLPLCRLLIEQHQCAS